MKTIVWFRRDLRLNDNPALNAAAKRGEVLPVYILDESGPDRGERPLGAASRWWLHHALTSLQRDLGDLVILKGDPATRLEELAQAEAVDAIYWNRCYEPGAIARDSRIKDELSGRIEVKSFPGSLLVEPWEIATGSGQPYKVFSPFWGALRQRDIPQPEQRAPRSLAQKGTGIELSGLNLLPPRQNWAEGWEQMWSPGEVGAMDALARFFDEKLPDYAAGRDKPAVEVTSRLSPHLHFGEISPHQIWHATRLHAELHPENANAAEKFLSELAWREFSAHLLYHFPTLPEQNWKPEFDAYPWRNAPEELAAWQKGQTGYPMVDAGMRELWATGYMHNRVRMIAASFLIKHLRIHWREGEAWFWNTLVDADLANNSASWQWVAGSGADASPYFRIFNPITQGRKFDPDGAYVRRWCPELKDLPDAHIHAPFEAPEKILAGAGVRLGETYPAPIVKHAEARQHALSGYDVVKQAKEA